MDDEQLLRYNRQIMLPQIGVEGQQRLRAARVLVVGLGGLGCPVAMYLAGSGVGELVLTDPDRVELTNLQRQILYRSDDIGCDKVEAAQRNLAVLNPEVRFTTFNKKLDADELAGVVRHVDLVVDACDNFSTRFMLNRVCHEARRPLVSGAVIRFEGQVAVFRHDRPDTPCYRCLYQDMDELAESCSETGILGSVAGIIGATQATEAVKVLLGIGEDLGGRLLVLDALRMEWRSLRLRRDPDCPVCG
jgi:adenylyltransferase/sulfurtransferase